MVPHKARSVVPVLVYAVDLISLLSEEPDHIVPSERVVPLLCLGGSLGAYHTVLFLYRSGSGKVYSRWNIFIIHSQNICGSPVETDLPEVKRLPLSVSSEEQSHVVSGIRLEVQTILAGDQFDAGILFLKEIYCKLRNCTGKFAMVFILESLHIGEPSYSVSYGTIREVYQHRLTIQIQTMNEQRLLFSFLEYFKPPVDEELLGAADKVSSFHVPLEHNGARILVHEYKLPFLIPGRKFYSESVIKVIEDPLRAFLGRDFGRR